MKFRKKPIIIEAEQWFFGKNIDGVVWGMNQNGRHSWIETLEGRMNVSDGDWIITGVNGEKYPCKPDIFEKTYENIEEENLVPETNDGQRWILFPHGLPRQGRIKIKDENGVIHEVVVEGNCLLIPKDFPLRGSVKAWRPLTENEQNWGRPGGYVSGS